MTTASPIIDVTPADLIAGIKDGSIVPYLGPQVLKGVVSKVDGAEIPADSDSLILAMNGGNPMAPRLMYEFPRAAMNLELKKGRKFIEKFLTTTYGETQWSDSEFHQWLAELQPAYIIDTNRDTQLQSFYKDVPHNLIVGIARIARVDFRFKLYSWDGTAYSEKTQETLDTSLPTLFKPMGTPMPEPNYVASDADYVDYITELMGGFGIPAFVKEYRKGKKYLFLGMRFLRDTERMILSDIIYDAAEPAGWAIVADPTEKELRYCAKKGIQIIEGDWQSILKSDAPMKKTA